MNNSNKVKYEQLGMPFGTAMGRLRKNIIFSLLLKLHENTCFKCKTPIATVDELTIEHKKPWLHVSPDLFWDIDNIAFSHPWCNKTDRPNGRPGIPRIIRPEGMQWCFKHKDFLPIENFSKSSKNIMGYKEICKEHHHYYRVK
jgi:hypothetical protein